jgi:hypothetical protein
MGERLLLIPDIMVISSKSGRWFPLLWPLLIMLLVVVSNQASAAKVSGLYSVEVPVENQGDDERRKAMTKALSGVLVKVTGQRSTLKNPGIQQALKKGTSYAQSFSYENRAIIEGRQLFLQVRFDEPAINRLLRENGLAIWDANRPDTIIWLAIEQGGVRRIQRETASSELVTDVKSVMAERSLPLTFPLMDFEDNTTISEVDVWGLFTGKLIQASMRYGSEAVLAGRLSFNGKTYNGRVVLLFRNQRFDASVTDLSAQGLAMAVADLVGDTLSHHYAVRSGSGEMNSVLTVSNVNTTKDYAGVVKYLKGLTAVRDVTVTRINGSSIELELLIDGTLNQLSDSLALGRQLRSEARNEFDQTLKYRWLGN